MSLKNLISIFFGKKQIESSNSKKSFDEIYDNLGIFEYNEDGFKITDEEFSKTIKWKDIDQINAYKKDLMAYDLVLMEIVCGEKALTINEESPGWFQFVIKTKEIFPTIQKDWELQITQPPFATNFTTIYTKS